MCSGSLSFLLYSYIRIFQSVTLWSIIDCSKNRSPKKGVFACRESYRNPITSVDQNSELCIAVARRVVLQSRLTKRVCE